MHEHPIRTKSFPFVMDYSDLRPVAEIREIYSTRDRDPGKLKAISPSDENRCRKRTETLEKKKKRKQSKYI